jgi:small-conductance mechanosensitive channel
MKNFIIKYVWQFPQMLAAWIWYLIRKKSILYNSIGNFYTVYVGANRGGVTLGDRIFISRCYHGEYLNMVIAHESGHVKQSLYLGPLYLIVIGIPSILWAWSHKWIAPKKSYYWFYTESNANKLGGVAVTSEGTLTWAHLVNKK